MNRWISIKSDGTDRRIIFEDAGANYGACFYEDYMYYVSFSTSPFGAIEYYINRCNRNDLTDNKSICVGTNRPSLLCMDSANEGAVLYYTSEEVVLNGVWSHYLHSVYSTDFEANSEVLYSVRDSAKTGFVALSVARDKYLYFYEPTYSSEGYEKEEMYLIPPVIPENEMLAYREKLEEEDSLLIQRYYKKYDINNLPKDADEETLVATYPIIKDEILYVLRDTTTDVVRMKLEELFEMAGYTEEAWMRHKALDMSMVEEIEKDTFFVSCIDPTNRRTITQKAMKNYIQSIDGFYKTDAIVQGIFDGKYGIYRINESEIWDLNCREITEAELLLETDRNQPVYVGEHVLYVLDQWGYYVEEIITLD